MKSKMAKSALLACVAIAGWAGGMASMSLAQAPRFPQLTLEQMDSQQRPIAEHILTFSRIGLGGPYHIMLRSPQAAKPIIDMMDYLRFQSRVPNRLREFSIMIQGRLWRSQVEWGSHYEPAIKAGVSAETLAELKTNRRPSSMQPDEAAVYDFCTELFTRHAVSEQTYGRLHQFLNDQQIVDLTLLQGLYVTVASVMAMANQGLPAGQENPFKPGEP